METNEKPSSSIACPSDLSGEEFIHFTEEIINGQSRLSHCAMCELRETSSEVRILDEKAFHVQLDIIASRIVLEILQAINAEIWRDTDRSCTASNMSPASSHRLMKRKDTESAASLTGITVHRSHYIHQILSPKPSGKQPAGHPSQTSHSDSLRGILRATLASLNRKTRMDLELSQRLEPSPQHRH